jgi:hypothetical protein
MRKTVLTTAAVLLIVEGLVLGLVGIVLGVAVNQQSMSFGGLDPALMALAAWIGQGVLAVAFVVAGVLVARAAARGAAAGTLTRVLLLIACVVNGVLGAAMLALMGVGVFVVLILLLALFVAAFLLLRDYPAPPVASKAPADAPRSPTPAA